MYLSHHGIKGQKWGVRRYQNPDGTLTAEGKRRAGINRINNSSMSDREKDIAYKKKTDFVLEKDSRLQTVSGSPDRLKDADMFYASHTKHDNAFYKSMYSVNYSEVLKQHKKPELKYVLSSKVTKNMTIASEKSGADAFAKLLNSNDEVKDFVFDPNKMRTYYTSRAPKKFEGYKEALSVLDRVSAKPNSKITKRDATTIYRLFNYTIPNNNASNVRSLFFEELKSRGYGGVFDTNDGLYGGFKTQSPVVIFDMEHVFNDSVTKMKVSDLPPSIVTSLRKNRSLIYK